MSTIESMHILQQIDHYLLSSENILPSLEIPATKSNKFIQQILTSKTWFNIDKFKNYYSKLLNHFFTSINDIIFCKECKNDIDCDNCLPDHGITDRDTIKSSFINLIDSLNMIYEKGQQIDPDNKLSNSVISIYNMSIIKMIKLWIIVNMSKFLENIVDNRNLVFMDQKVKDIMIKLNIFFFYKEVIINCVKVEITRKIESASNIYDKLILDDLLM